MSTLSFAGETQWQHIMNAVTDLRIHHNDIYLELLPKFMKKKKTLKRLVEVVCRKLLDDMDCDSCDAIGN